MHFLKKGQKIRAWVDPPPPPLIRAMPERKRFLFVDVFPKNSVLLKSPQNMPKYKITNWHIAKLYFPYIDIDGQLYNTKLVTTYCQVVKNMQLS